MYNLEYSVNLYVINELKLNVFMKLQKRQALTEFYVVSFDYCYNYHNGT